MMSRGGRPASLQPFNPRGAIQFAPLDVPGARTPVSSGPQTVQRLPATVNLVVYQGDDVGFSIAVFDEDGNPADIDGATLRSQIRVTQAAADISGEIDTEIGDGGVIEMHLTAAVSAALPRAAVWDVEMVLADWTTTLAAGTIAVTPDVTR